MKLIDCSTPKHPSTFAKVDDEDFDFLNQWKWYAYQPKGKKTKYALTNSSTARGRARTTLRMHRIVLKANSNQIIDHRDRDGLNNTKANLRFCDATESAYNRSRPETALNSPYRGVFLRKSLGTYQAHICVNGKKLHLGFFKNPDEAARAYNNAAIAYHGQFASLNEIPT